ncbi:NAD(P)/FAD-dependent oxidoreductase [Hyphococcus flavus]|uniref:NAD(P)/FAD-dependent oxidoreductase n=1 Tax=Hyphococcus flavus TaxID=1866326 RepID=A0AAE9ZBU1_9PROT|nr:NAD(P)/FAD-dependent oxidoreductase [Hyphococcus flavus]WDI31834.1 NAD(P)/FAD-dependent oxidoreductase [Hyphococcus flavus]
MKRTAPETHDCDCVVIGAGVVGLACAAQLARAGREVLVLEKNNMIGSETSSRNSEVIHAGIYYPPQSLKAQTCISGRRLLIQYVKERHIDFHLCGKLIVATNDDEVITLEKLHTNARDSGVSNLEWIDQSQLSTVEPALSATAALLSPGTGIVDSHHFMTSLHGDLEDQGGMIAFGTSVDSGTVENDKIVLFTDTAKLKCETVVNAAGLYAPALAGTIEGVNVRSLPRQHLAKGSYFTSSERSPFRRLIYPAPADGGLGVHVTLDLAGRMRFGPDVEWLEEDNPSAADYRVEHGRADRFYHAIRKYWPGLPDGALAPDYAGIRPKLSPKGAPAADFQIQDEREHGVPGLINLFGIESPGLTASLALAEIVLDRTQNNPRSFDLVGGGA